MVGTKLVLRRKKMEMLERQDPVVLELVRMLIMG